MDRVSIDIETIPLGAALLPAELVAAAEAEGMSRFLVKGEAATEEEIKKLSLDSITSRIVAIALAKFDQNSNPKESTVLYGEDEAKILDAFWKFLEKPAPVQLVAHNGLTFDLPFIWRRSVIQNVRPSKQFNLARYRTDTIYDTMQLWANWNIRDYVGLDRLSAALGLGAKTGTGSQVLGLWLEGKHEEVAKYCYQDALLTYACFCRMNFLPIPDLRSLEESCALQFF
jgi:predicted PolB exonuclease-like 3'-5' exonuclease